MSYFAKLFRSPQTGRIARLMLFTLISAAVTVPLVQQWEARYPLLGGIIGLLEGLYRVAVPTQPAPRVTAVLADPSPTIDPAPPTAKG
jgi:hypothetical protein